MKKKLLLSQLNKDSMEPRQTSQLMGGNYCAFGDNNRDANETGGVCSCMCDHDTYYGSHGLDYEASFYKATNNLFSYCY